MERIEQILEMGKANREEMGEDFEECFPHGKKARHLYAAVRITYTDFNDLFSCTRNMGDGIHVQQ